MSIRKRTWITGNGDEKTAWVVDYVDTKGKRRLKTFAKKKDADQFAATATVEVREGSHVADSASATVAVAGRLWIASSEAAGLERTTTESYRSHVDLHIAPFIGAVKLSAISVPSVRSFEDHLRDQGRSPAMVRKVLVSLSSIISDAQERGLVARNVVRDMKARRRTGTAGSTEKRRKGKLRVGVDIPTREEIKAIVTALEGRWRPMLITAIFTGLRASELRGLTWSDVDLEKREIRVHQRADRYGEIGPPKSASGARRVPLPPIVVDILAEWQQHCPAGSLGLVFPNGKGNAENLTNLVKRGLHPVQEKAGVVDAEGKAKYSGMHALRHFYASWCINRQSDGGLGLPPKMVQDRLGHASIVMTMNVYSHLFPSVDDEDQMAKAQAELLN